MTEPVSRFTFPYPTETCAQLRNAIVWLMMDGKPRSILEIQEALGTRKEIGARIRELRTASYGGWAFNDSRHDGPDDDGVFRYRLTTRTGQSAPPQAESGPEPPDSGPVGLRNPGDPE